MKYYRHARPEADPRGRPAATRETIKYLRAAKRHYDAALEGTMSDSDRRRVGSELTHVQRLLYWCTKFQSTRRGQ